MCGMSAGVPHGILCARSGHVGMPWGNSSAEKEAGRGHGQPADSSAPQTPQVGHLPAHQCPLLMEAFDASGCVSCPHPIRFHNQMKASGFWDTGGGGEESTACTM